MSARNVDIFLALRERHSRGVRGIVKGLRFTKCCAKDDWYELRRIGVRAFPEGTKSEWEGVLRAIRAKSTTGYKRLAVISGPLYTQFINVRNDGIVNVTNADLPSLILEIETVLQGSK